MKKSIIFLSCFFISVIKPWTWPVVIENRTQNPRVKLSVVDEYIYSLPKQNKVFIRDQDINLIQIVLPPQNLTPPPIGRRIQIWTQMPRGGAVIRSNKIIICQPHLIKQEEIGQHFIFPREPSGNYQVYWDRHHNLIINQEKGYHQALDLFASSPFGYRTQLP